MKIGNWPLLLLALEHVYKHPELYDQASWRGWSSCRTTRCIAGWIAKFAGYRDPLSGNNVQVITPEGDDSDYTSWRYVDTAALDALELDPSRLGVRKEISDRLFDGALHWREILEAVRDFAEADGVTPTPLLVSEMYDAGLIDSAHCWKR